MEKRCLVLERRKVDPGSALTSVTLKAPTIPPSHLTCSSTPTKYWHCPQRPFCCFHTDLPKLGGVEEVQLGLVLCQGPLRIHTAHKRMVPEHLSES